MATCLVCSSAGSEVTGHRTSTTGAYHRDCAYLAYLLAEAPKAPYPDAVKQVQIRIDHMTLKRAGTPTDFP